MLMELALVLPVCDAAFYAIMYVWLCSVHILVGFCCFTGLDFPWRETAKLTTSPVKSPQTGHRRMFAQVENKSKLNAYGNTTGSTKPAQSVFWFWLQGFSPSARKAQKRNFLFPEVAGRRNKVYF